MNYFFFILCGASLNFSFIEKYKDKKLHDITYGYYSSNNIYVYKHHTTNDHFENVKNFLFTFFLCFVFCIFFFFILCYFYFSLPNGIFCCDDGKIVASRRMFGRMSRRCNVTCIYKTLQQLLSLQFFAFFPYFLEIKKKNIMSQVCMVQKS